MGDRYCEEPLELGGFRVGDEVNILDKSVYGSALSSAIWRKFRHGKPAYVTKIKPYQGTPALLVDNGHTGTGDYFLPSDLRHMYSLRSDVDNMFEELIYEVENI